MKLDSWHRNGDVILILETDNHVIIEHVDTFIIRPRDKGWDGSLELPKKELDCIFGYSFNYLRSLTKSELDDVCIKLIKLKAFL